MSSTSGYVSVQLPVTPTEIQEESFSYMRSNIEGWEPSADPDTALIEANARPAAETREAAVSNLDEAFLQIGTMIPDAARGEEAHAFVTSTWTFTDTLTHTIYDGTQVLLGPEDDAIAFLVDGDYVHPAGTNTTPAGAITLIAAEPGTAANNLSGTGRLVEQPPHVNTVTIVGVTSSGADQEPTEEYRDRLSDELRILSPSPIMTEDFPVIARRVPEVERAVAINGYNPTNSTYNNALHMAVCPIDAYGAPISDAGKTQLSDLYASLLLQNYVVHLFNPTVTPIDVSFEFDVVPGYDPDDVLDRAIAAVSDYLDPAWWGQPPGGDKREWLDDLTVRYLEVAEMLNRVDGLWRLTTLTMRKGANAFAAANVSITGPAALASAGVITGAATT